MSKAQTHSKVTFQKERKYSILHKLKCLNVFKIQYILYGSRLISKANDFIDILFLNL